MEHQAEYEPPRTPAPERFAVGDRIDFIPAGGMFGPMTVLEVKDCETDYARPHPHAQYRVIDPEGNEDWICGYDAAGAR